jgi:hypothetical protein
VRCRQVREHHSGIPIRYSLMICTNRAAHSLIDESFNVALRSRGLLALKTRPTIRINTGLDATAHRSLPRSWRAVVADGRDIASSTATDA